MVTPDPLRGQFALRQWRQASFVEQVHRVRAAEQHRETARLLGDLGEELFVQTRFDGVPFGILDKLGAALGVDGAQQLPAGRPHTDGEDAQAVLRRGLGRFQGVAVQIFSIGDQDQNLVIIVAFFEGALGGINRLGQRGAALRNDVHIEGLHALAEGLVIQRQRTLQKGAPSEGDKAVPFGLRHPFQIECCELSAPQPVRSHVGGQHAARGVDGNHDVQAARARLFPAESNLRAGQDHNEQGHRHHQQGHPSLLPPRRQAHGQVGQQPRRDKLRHQAPLVLSHIGDLDALVQADPQRLAEVVAQLVAAVRDETRYRFRAALAAQRVSVAHRPQIRHAFEVLGAERNPRRPAKRPISADDGNL